MSEITKQFQSLVTFFKETSFSKAISVVFAAVLPLILFYQIGNISVGIGLTVGVFLCSPGDAPGDFKRRVYGILVSIGIAVTCSLVAGYASANTLIFVLVMASLVFLLSFIAVFGFRASLVSFSGLMAVVLSMASIAPDTSILVHSLYIGIGGLWYLFLVSLIHFINPKRAAEGQLADVSKLTASYLRTRTELIQAPRDSQKELLKELTDIQTELNASHEVIREILISKRKTSGKSNNARKKLLIFMELVDLLELGMANPVNTQRMRSIAKQHAEELQLLREWTFKMADQLEDVSIRLRKNNKYVPNLELDDFSDRVRNKIEEVRKKRSSDPEDLDLMSLYHFKEKQYQKVTSIERLLQDLEGEEEFKIKQKDVVKFIPAQEYSFKTLQDNFDFKSPVFRHSLRLTLIVLLGYFTGAVLDLQNSYWILLTSIVIMRPGYALTKLRSKQRLLGTLIGGVVAAVIILLIQNKILYGVLAVITFVFALSMIQKNYKTSAAFITLNVVFIYALITPNAFEVIQFRVLDTLIGSALAFMGNAFLWPTWEYRGIKDVIVESLKANRSYLKEIEAAYRDKDRESTPYKLARKEAFLAISALSAAFQRMTQEPKSKQKEMERIYKIVSLNQELLSSATSLGSFIRTHQTTKASEHFNTFIAAIQANLSNSIDKLQHKPAQEVLNGDKLEEAEIYFKGIYQQLFELKKQDYDTTSERDVGIGIRFDEVRLLTDQLKWLLEISTSLQNLCSRVEN